MKELTIEDVSHKAIQSARLWLMGYMTTAEWQDPEDEYDYEYDEWNHSDGWDLNLYQVRNTVKVYAYPFVDGETVTDRWVVLAEDTVKPKDTNVVPQERCERCGEETPNGVGHFQDELGTEERLCGECYKKEMCERMGINNWAFTFADLVDQILGSKQ